MLDKFLVLLERFVVAHELIAANSKTSVYTELAAPTLEWIDTSPELPVEGADVIDTPKKGAKAQPADDLDDEEPQEKPKRQPRQTKPKDEPKGPDIGALREDIKTIAKAIAAGDSDECADLFDELLEDFSVRTVTKLPDSEVEAFHKAAKKLVSKFYDVED
jgi:hypothetical protein